MQPVTGSPLMWLSKKQKIWTENQCPIERVSSFVNETLDKIVSKEKITSKSHKNEQHLKTTISLIKNDIKPMFSVQCREKITKNSRSRLKTVFDIQIVFTTKNLRTCMSTLKPSFTKNLESHMVDKLSKNRCHFTCKFYPNQPSGYH